MPGRHRKPPTPGRHRKPPGPSRWVAPTLVVVALLGAGGVGARAALSGGGSESPAAPTAARPVLPASAASATATVSPTSSPPPAAVASSAPASTPAPGPRPAAHPAALAVTVTGRISWVEVTRPSGHVLVSGIIRHGRHLAFRHGPLHVVIGDAGAVRLVRHGHAHAPAGRPGQVLRFTVR